MAGIGWLVARPLRNIDHLAQTGAPGHATVRRAWRTGLYMNRMGDKPRHQLGFEVEVHPEDGGDYVATAAGVLTEAEEAALKPGAEASVRYDPAHPAHVVVIGPLGAAAG